VNNNDAISINNLWQLLFTYHDRTTWWLGFFAKNASQKKGY
jgi:hypothetical protein